MLWLSGWSIPADIFQPYLLHWPHNQHYALDFNNCNKPDEIIATAKKALRELPKAYLIGWSLGALVALELAKLHPERVLKLLLIAAVPQFVRSKLNPAGVPRKTLQQMAQALEQDKAKTLAGFDRSLFTRKERQYLPAFKKAFRNNLPSTASLLSGLDYLARFNAHPYLPKLSPVSLLVGLQDAICSPESSKQLSKLHPSSHLSIWPDGGHISFWIKQKQFLNWLEQQLAQERQL